MDVMPPIAGRLLIIFGKFLLAEVIALVTLVFKVRFALLI